MTKLAFLEIDQDPANVAAMMQRGHFHSHQDGRWRYSPFGGETVHVNDPTEAFDTRAEFAKGYGAAVHLESGLYAEIHGDGTRGLRTWNRRNADHLWTLYAPRDEGERARREWLSATLP